MDREQILAHAEGLAKSMISARYSTMQKRKDGTEYEDVTTGVDHNEVKKMYAIFCDMGANFEEFAGEFKSRLLKSGFVTRSNKTVGYYCNMFDSLERHFAKIPFSKNAIEAANHAKEIFGWAARLLQYNEKAGKSPFALSETKSPQNVKKYIEMDLEGTVKWYNQNKKYGVIDRDDGKGEVFVHFTALPRGTFLTKGQSVQFHTAKRKNKEELEAKEVRILKS